jgi:hypothetical protein
MRVTLNIRDEVWAKVKQYAKDRKITLSAAANYRLVEGFRTLGAIIQSGSTNLEGNDHTPRSKTAPRA